MIKRLREVVPGKLFRGSAPSPKDVLWLKDVFGINKIVSLDKAAGERIDRSTKILNIKHIMMPIEFKDFRQSLINFLLSDLKSLLITDGPTYVHCAEGKDRTGLVIALYQCKYMGKDPDDAIEEAKSLGFGIGVDPEVISMFEKIIRSCKKDKDTNNADIVSNEREYIGDNRDSFLDEGHQGSFAPYLSETKQYPMDNVYNEINSQSPTRDNYSDYKSIKEHNSDKDVIPQVGVFNNDAGIHGAGPAEPVGGFIYD